MDLESPQRGPPPARRSPIEAFPPARASRSRCAALRARRRAPAGGPRLEQAGAAHRSAARAGGARPVPFRTRKLSRRAPRVLRGQPVGGQGAADRWTAPPSRGRIEGPFGAPSAISGGPAGPSAFQGPCGASPLFQVGLRALPLHEGPFGVFSVFRGPGPPFVFVGGVLNRGRALSMRVS